MIAPGDGYLTPREVAAIFRVDPKTVSRWARPGRGGKPPRIPSTVTPGGHHRFLRSDVERLLREGSQQ